MNPSSVTVEATINAPIAKVWDLWTKPEHIMKWNSASPDWHTPRATNDLREGGEFTARMEAKDGSAGFDFGGKYTRVLELSQIMYVMSDGRKVNVTFDEQGDRTLITETFDAESQNPTEMQRAGWQSILNNFKKYAESQAVS